MEPFYALIMAAMRQADTDNLERLKEAFPDVWAELSTRYMREGGFLPGEYKRLQKLGVAIEKRP